MANLRAHRRALSQNLAAYEQDLDRAKRTVVEHLRKCGYVLLKPNRPNAATDAYVEAIFEAQDRKPFFHVTGDLPFCWNAPANWNLPYIHYQWGHLRSRNQNEDAHELTNLCLMSERCNQHVQSALDISEVRDWLLGSRVAERIDQVLASRRALFASPRWDSLLAGLEAYRPPRTIDFF
jgi:hypothetical protein